MARLPPCGNVRGTRARHVLRRRGVGAAARRPGPPRNIDGQARGAQWLARPGAVGARPSARGHGCVLHSAPRRDAARGGVGGRRVGARAGTTLAVWERAPPAAWSRRGGVGPGAPSRASTQGLGPPSRAQGMVTYEAVVEGEVAVPWLPDADAEAPRGRAASPRGGTRSRTPRAARWPGDRVAALGLPVAAGSRPGPTLPLGDVGHSPVPTRGRSPPTETTDDECRPHRTTVRTTSRSAEALRLIELDIELAWALRGDAVFEGSSRAQSSTSARAGARGRSPAWDRLPSRVSTCAPRARGPVGTRTESTLP